MKETYAQKQIRKELKAPAWVKECVEYWGDKVYEGDLGTDFSEATINCWRCGHLRKLQKCHIIPKSLGGEDKPENIIPLCYQCHDEMPDVSDKEEVFRWIKSDHGTSYDTFWLGKSLELADIDFESALKDCEDPKQKTAFYLERYEFYLNNHSSSHFGQFTGGCKIKPATRAWVMKKAYIDTFGEIP